MKHAPEAKMPFLTYYRMAMHNPIELRTCMFKKYGDIVWRKTKGFINYNIAHPDYAKHILEDNQDNYFSKNPLFRDIFVPIFGKKSVFTVNNKQEWQPLRTLLGVSFDPRRYFSDYADKIIEIYNQVFDQWHASNNNGDYVNVSHMLDPLVLTLLAETVFTHIPDFDSKQLDTVITDCLEVIKNKLITPSLLWWLSPTRKNYAKKMGAAKKWTHDVINKRMCSARKWDDLIGVFSHENSNYSRQDILEIMTDQIITLFAAVYFNLSSLLHWSIVTLSMLPDVERQIKQEVQRKIADKTPVYSDLDTFSYLPMVIKEILRLHPPSHLIMRQAISDDVINGIHIPAQVGINISTYHINRHQDFWSNPQGFDPERFSNNPLGNEHSFAYLPFGNGSRQCPAAAYSVLAAKLFIIMFVRRFALYLPPHHEVRDYATTILNMRPNINMMRLQFN